MSNLRIGTRDRRNEKLFESPLEKGHFGNGFEIVFTSSENLYLYQDPSDSGMTDTSIFLFGISLRVITSVFFSFFFQLTEYETLYPSCLQLYNIQSTCDASSVTIQPTSISSQTTEPTKITDHQYEVVERSDLDISGVTMRRYVLSNIMCIHPFVEKLILFISENRLHHRYEVLEPSMEEAPDFNEPTPQPTALLGEPPELQFVTEYLTVSPTKVYVTNYATTATVIAHNCIPPKADLKLCSVPNKDEGKKADFIQSKTESTASKKIDLFDKLNEYILRNANRLLETDGYESLHLETDSKVEAENSEMAIKNAGE